jgi:hypothetical protein
MFEIHITKAVHASIIYRLRTRVYGRMLDRITNVFRFKQKKENGKSNRNSWQKCVPLFFILIRFAWEIPSFALDVVLSIRKKYGVAKWHGLTVACGW